RSQAPLARPLRGKRRAGTPDLRAAGQRRIHQGLQPPAANLQGARQARHGDGLMAIGVKVLERPPREVSYVRATLKGMALTFKHMFEPKVTMQYPEQKSTTDWGISQRWRGTHRMLTDEQGRSKCVA